MHITPSDAIARITAHYTSGGETKIETMEEDKEMTDIEPVGMEVMEHEN